MSRYLIKFYDKYGNLVSQTIEEYSSNVGKFQQNKLLDKKDGYRSSYRSAKTDGGLNRKVIKYTSVNQYDGSKVVATLINRKKR